MRLSKPRQAAIAALTAAVLIGVTACTGTPTAPASSSADADATLVYGVIGTATDTTTPWSLTGSLSTQMIHTELYDGLTVSQPDGTTAMALAESMTPNADLTEWTVKLRQGVKLHDGSTFTSDDVIDSIKRLLDSDPKLPGAKLISFVDESKLVKVDDTTLTIGLTSPYALLPDIFANIRLLMAHWNADGTPVGTGPFVVQSFTANQQAQLVRFDDYWGQKPGFKNLTVQYFQSQDAITNALRGGQIDVAATVPFTDVSSLKSTPGINLLASDTNQAPTISFRVDAPPFNDPRVVQALKLLVDRDQIVSNAYGGYATVANDWFGPGTGCPDPDVAQRQYNVDEAKKLLAEAGQSNLSFTLVTDNGFAGMLEMAQLFSQEAAKAGVTIKVSNPQPAEFLASWGKWPAYLGLISGNYASVSQNYYLPGQSNNSVHFDNADYNKLYAQMITTADQKARCAIVNQMQQIDYEFNGSIIPAYQQTIIAYRDGVNGLQKDLYGRASYQFGGVTVTK